MKRLSGLLFHNLRWKALSLLVAVVLWALVASEPEHATWATARLVYKDLPDDLELSSEPVTAVSLELRGPSGELSALGKDDAHPAVVLDMSGVRAGERTFPIGSDNIKLPRRVRLVRAVPSEARFRFEPRLERKVAVKARFAGEGQNGYVVAQHSVAPEQVSIVGPSSRVAAINAVVTDPVDVSRVVGTQEFRVNAFVDDPYVRFESSPQVTVAVTMIRR
jgi:YbbR domain-containing protein